MLRLEGHDLMDFRREQSKKKGKWGKNKTKVGAGGTGGSDGCVNFKDPDNAGLESCIKWTGIESIYAEWCDQISLADFMVLAGEAVVGSISVNHNELEPFKKDTLLA